MPKIFLKPNSAEFADTEEINSATQYCDMPGCAQEGEFKAPKHRGLNEYYHFCLDHVRDYNKAWNFFEGMSDQEIENHTVNSFYGDRPTWRYGVEGTAEDILHKRAWQQYHFTDKEPPKNGHSNGPQENHQHTPELEALAIMGLEPPVTLDVIKTEYKKLAKKHHPDRNRGCTKSEDMLKSINMAYTILKLAYSEFEKLPERN